MTKTNHEANDQDPSIGMISRLGNFLRKKKEIVALVGTLALAGCTDESPEGPAPTPTSISTETPVDAPEMVPYILTQEQINALNSPDLNEAVAVQGETIIPAIQAYVDNLVAAERLGEDLHDVDPSSVTQNPTSTLIVQLRSMVSSQSENDAQFIVCGTLPENTPEVCLNKSFSGLLNRDGMTNEIYIVRTDIADPNGTSEENNIRIELKEGAGVLSITPEGQIVVN